MQSADFEAQPASTSPAIHWGHFGAVFAVMLLLLGISWMEKPQLFEFKKPVAVNDPNVPHYYAYVAPDADQPQVLGDSTVNGPQIINDDGTVSAAIAPGEVLSANTQDVVLSLDAIKVNSIPDSDQAISSYLSQSQSIERSFMNSAAFETALASGNQQLINAQSQNITKIEDALGKLQVPQSLVQLQKLKIAQYNAAITLLNNFTQADSNPQLVANGIDNFLAAQQQLDTQNQLIAQKYPSANYVAGPTAQEMMTQALSVDNSNSAAQTGDSGNNNGQ